MFGLGVETRFGAPHRRCFLACKDVKMRCVRTSDDARSLVQARPGPGSPVATLTEMPIGLCARFVLPVYGVLGANPLAAPFSGVEAASIQPPGIWHLGLKKGAYLGGGCRLVTYPRGLGFASGGRTPNRRGTPRWLLFVDVYRCKAHPEQCDPGLKEKPKTPLFSLYGVD